MIPLIPAQYRIAAFAIGATLLFLTGLGTGYLKGVRDEADRHADYRAAVEAAQARVAAENEAKLDEAQRNTGEVAAIYAGVADSVRRDYSSRLERVLQRQRDREATAALTGPATRPDEAPGDTGPCAPALTACRGLESDCAATTGQLIWLQHWVRKVCK